MASKFFCVGQEATGLDGMETSRRLNFVYAHRLSWFLCYYRYNFVSFQRLFSLHLLSAFYSSVRFGFEAVVLFCGCLANTISRRLLAWNVKSFDTGLSLHSSKGFTASYGMECDGMGLYGLQHNRRGHKPKIDTKKRDCWMESENRENQMK